MARHTALYLIHQTNDEHLEQVMADMAKMGAPTVRVVDCGDHYMAIEGCHRLTAAARLGIAPVLEVLDQDDMVEADSLQLEDILTPGQSYTAGEIAGELHGMLNPVLTISRDGTLS